MKKLKNSDEFKIKEKGRYSTSGLEEGEFESGSYNRVLKNNLGIKHKREIDAEETKAYDDLVEKVINQFGCDHQFTVNDICNMHKLWLGDIYSWAGGYRQVNMSKDGFTFAAAHFLPKLMHEFEKDILKKYTPCNVSDVDEIVKAIAIVHTEFILIHTFREGNGRLGRLIAVMMGLQAGLPILNFEAIKGRKRQEYFIAVQAGMDRNYEPMEKIFQSIIKRTIKLYAS